MSLSTDNTGLIILGTCEDGIPTSAGVSFPTASGNCKAHLSWKSGAKSKKASAAGKSAAKTTFTGKKVGEVEIDIEWLDVDGTAEEVEAALLIISPGGPNAGKTWDLTARWADIHGVGAVMLVDMNGPTPVKNSNEVTCKIKCEAWTKPVNSGAGTGKTPTTAATYAVQGGALGAAGVKFTVEPTVETPGGGTAPAPGQAGSSVPVVNP